MSLPLRPALALPIALLVAVTAPLAAQDDAALVARARAIHDRVMTLDTHVDISPTAFRRDSTNYVTGIARNQVDIPKMESGGLDAAFLIVYVGQARTIDSATMASAYAQAMEKFAAVHRLTDSLAPTRVGLARTADEARRIHASGRKVIFIGIENGFSVGTDLSRIRQFAELGGRYMSLAHNGHSQFSDSNTGERDGVWMWNGLSPLGRQAIAELNKWGVMIDISHPSKQSMMQTLELTQAPIIASHSGVRALCNHSRNLDDEQLLGMKRNGGVVQLVAFNSYVKCNPVRDAERQGAIDALRRQYGVTGTNPREVQASVQALPEERRNAYLAAQEDITARRYPADPMATVADFANHIDYAVKLIGIDHVGISSDFDGGGGVDGWRNASETFNVTLELVRRGYTEEQIAKIWSGNLLRVLTEVQAVSARLQRAAR
ncbi:MAG: dipeptidase [Gemmatimonadaceae bacterium]|jgi:membrane dipeptidase|nr:dipeptidase [Gemmatimonadaceae bacterium]